MKVNRERLKQTEELLLPKWELGQFIGPSETNYLCPLGRERLYSSLAFLGGPWPGSILGLHP